MRLYLQPITIAEAKVYIREHHRHHKPPTSALFAVAVNDGARVVGVATIGRPVARGRQDGYTAEVTRCCVEEGHKNACSMLYGRAWRCAKAMGYTKMITYILDSETGVSLKASNWKMEKQVKGNDLAWSKRKETATGYTKNRQLSFTTKTDKQRWCIE